VPSKGCGTSTAGASDQEQHNLTVAGVDRFYLLTTPAKHDGRTPLPLVVDFHGLSEGAQIHAKMTGFGALAQKQGFVVVFPNGTGTPVRWDANTTSNPNHDVEYVDRMLDEIGTNLCIDTSRVYATGLSYGAIMSSFLTCTRANRFAAVAPVAGITVPPDNCTPSRPMPVLSFHGTADPILNFNGGLGDSLSGILKGKVEEAATTPTTAKPADLNGPGYPAAVKAWAARNGCGPDPVDTKVTDAVIHRVYPCPAGADVEFYIIVGGGHSWPGSEFSRSIGNIVGPTTFDVNATELAWQFFQRFQLPAPAA
jgi:polyhydroxybutyrate depolymerase